jgi:excisionase family DNA binding protein
MNARKTPERTGGKIVTSALFTVSEAAKYLGVSRGTIYQLIEWGEVKAVKLGRAVQGEKDSLDRYRAQGKLT